jgi:hypothetical protein
VDKNYVSEISNVEKGLKGINAQIADMEAGLKRISGLAGTTLGSVKSVLGGGLGQGSSLNIGTANASFSNGAGSNTGMNAATGSGGLMSWMYSGAGQKGMMGVQLGLGVAGAAYAGLPDTGQVMSRATGFYNLAQRSGGMNRKDIAAATFSSMAGGITGPNEDMAAASVLSLGYGYSPGSANFTNILKETRGAALGYNMPNATAAQALASMHTGAMAGNLYAYGISTFDVKTGQNRSMGDITRQLYQRMVGSKKLTQKDIEISATQGFLGQSLNALGFSQAQKELVTQGFINLSQGKSAELTAQTGQDNPLKKMYDVYTSQSALANRAADPYIKGVGIAADKMVAFNNAMSKLPDSILAAKAAFDTFSNSNAGNATSALVKGVEGAATVYAGSKILSKVLGKGAVKGGITLAEHGLSAVAAKTAGKVLGKSVPILGGVISGATGQGFFSSVAMDAAIGGAGGAFVGGVGAVPGAIGGAVYGAAGYLLGKGVRSFFGSGSTSATSSNPTPLSGSQNETAWAKDFLKQVGAPVTSQNIAAMTTWMAAEGGGGGGATGLGINDAMYNPLNTKQHMPGSWKPGDMSEDVQAYQNYASGMQATVKTIKNGRYTNILAALKKGNDASGVLAAVNASPWGTHIAGVGASTASNNVNINLNIAQASEAEAITLAKRVKTILQKDFGVQTMGSK